MADSSVSTGASGAPIRVLTALGAGVADQQVVTLADSAGNLLGTSAAPMPIDSPDTTTSFGLAAVGSVPITTSGGNGTVGVQVTGTFVATLVFEATTDGTNFFAVNAIASVSGAQVTTASAPGQWRINAGGYVQVRVRASAYTSGTAAVTLVASSASTMSTLAEPLPAGTNLIGLITGSGVAGTPATGVQTVQGIAGGVTLPVTPPPSTLMVSTTAAVTTALTATLPAAGAGLFHYITSIYIKRYAGAALTGAAAPVVVTTTNLPGSLAFTFDTAAAIGTSEAQQSAFGADPLKSSVANTATTIVAPAVTNGLWRINVAYFTAT